MTAEEDVPLFNWYLRYPVGPADMDQFQASVVQLPRDTFGDLHGASLLAGGTIAPSGSTMAVTVAAFSALNDDGYLCVKEATSLVAIAASHATLHRYDLVVARPSLEDDQTISRPTPPFDNVPLYELQNCSLVVIQGANNASPVVPSKVAGDVILASVYVQATATSISGGNINQTTHHDIGNCVRFSAATKNVTVRARSGNTAAFTGYGFGTGSGGTFTGGADASGGGGVGVTGIGGAGGSPGGDFFGIGDGSASGDYSIVSRQNIWMFGSDPGPTTGFTNMLTPMNLIKAWADITLNGTTPVVAAGFNVTNPRYSGNNLLVDIVSDLAAQVGAVLVTWGASGASTVVAKGYLSAAGTVTIEAFGSTTGTAYDLSAVNSAAFHLSFAVLGAQ